MGQIQPQHECNKSSLIEEHGGLITRQQCGTLLDVVTLATVLPGIDEVLGDVDTGWWACDRDLACSRAISGAGNFDVSSRDLTDLIDLAALPSNYAANKLQGEMEKHVNNKPGHVPMIFIIKCKKKTHGSTQALSDILTAQSILHIKLPL